MNRQPESTNDLGRLICRRRIGRSQLRLDTPHFWTCGISAGHFNNRCPSSRITGDAGSLDLRLRPCFKLALATHSRMKPACLTEVLNERGFLIPSPPAPLPTNSGCACSLGYRFRPNLRGEGSKVVWCCVLIGDGVAMVLIGDGLVMAVVW